HLPQRLRADLAAQAHPCPTAKRDLDDAFAIRPPRPTALRRNLDRHHGAAFDHRFRPPLSTTAFGNSCRRHLNSWLLFTSWRRATTDTDAPAACVSATIWRFSASEYCRRFVGPACCLVSTKPVVDTCSARSAIR